LRKPKEKERADSNSQIFYMPPIMENPALERDSEIMKRTAAVHMGDLRNDYHVEKANRRK